MNFWKSSKGGRGGHFRSKKFRCNFFCIRNCTFGHEFPEKLWNRGGSFPIQKISLQIQCWSSWISEKIATFFPKKGRGWGVKGGSEIFRKFIHFRADSLPLLLDNISQIFDVYFSDLASCFLLHILLDISNSCNIKKGSASFPHGCGVKVLLLRDMLGQHVVSSMKAGIENRINKSALVICELELNASTGKGGKG